MGIRVVRLGTTRARNEGLRIDTVRRPPRGVSKADHSRRNYYDVWLPELAPGAPIISWALAAPWTPARWRRYVRVYLREMREPRARHLIGAHSILYSKMPQRDRNVLRDVLGFPSVDAGDGWLIFGLPPSRGPGERSPAGPRRRARGWPPGRARRSRRPGHGSAQAHGMTRTAALAFQRAERPA